jgi:hypothetical protein
MTRTVRIASLALVGLGLIYVLVLRAGVTWPAFVISIGKTAGWALALFVALTGANLAFGALKWLLVLRDFAPGSGLQPKFAEAMLTSALGELVGQVMPVQAGITLVRSFASRLGVGWSLWGNLGTTIYEQLFDLLVVGTAAVVGLLGMTLRIGPTGWGFLILTSAACAIVLSLRIPALLTSQAIWVWRILGRPGLASDFGSSAMSRASSSVAAHLTVLSILRFISNLMRIMVLLGALGMLAYAIPAATCFPLVQIVGAMPITPGNLGVIEWTWSAVLVSSGATMGGAALFALTARTVNLVALSILIGIILGYLILQARLRLGVAGRNN